jgi:hypothetical protein
MGLQVEALSLARQGDFVGWSGAALLDDAVKEDDLLAVDDEEDTGYAVIQRRADFPQALPHGIDQRFPDRPSPLNSEDVSADNLHVLLGEFAKPIPDRLVSRLRSEEVGFERARRGLWHALGLYQI